MAHELKLHQRPTPAAIHLMTINDRECRNRVWWTCFLMDACSSALADRPTFVNVDEVTASLPDDDLWNGLDDVGLPLAGSKGDHIATNAARRGMSGLFGFGAPVKQVPSAAGSTDVSQRFPSYGFREFVVLMKIFTRILTYIRGNKATEAALHSTLGVVDPELTT